MRITVCQLDWRAIEAEWRALCAHVKDARSEFLLLPEMVFDDWLPATRAFDAGKWAGSVANHEQWLERLPELGVSVVAGTRPVGAGEQRRNRAFLWTAGGALREPHDKYYVPNEPEYWEAEWYHRADRPAFDINRVGDIDCGFQICTEMWFFHHARAMGQAGAHLLLVPRATPHESVDNWLAGGRVAAIVSGAYCLSSNQYAAPGGAANLGGSGFVCDPEGEMLALTTPDQPFITLDIDIAVAEAAKKTYPRYVPD